jgi:uncharacterized protein YpiB (UPF0302 family)
LKKSFGVKNLSLKLDDKTFEETEKILEDLQINRNRYINKAISFYNHLQKRKQLAARLANESHLVRSESMKALAEFENLDDEATTV